MAEVATALTRLRVVCDLHEDDLGATVLFQDGGHARLVRRDPAYAMRHRLAQRSQERQHPVGVAIGAGEAIILLVRADNDIPLELVPEPSGTARVLFQGHDAVFHLRLDHPDAARISAGLADAVRTRAPVWFIADKPSLILLDLVPVSETLVPHNGTGAKSASREAQT